MPAPLWYRRHWPNASGVAVVFSPEDISGMQLWFKADAITGLNDTDPVGTWADSSGNSRDATQATASKKPLYRTNILNGKPVVRFDGTDDWLATGTFTAVTTPYTFVTVAKMTSSNTERIIDSNLRALFGGKTGDDYQMYAGTELLDGTRDTNYHIFAAVFNGASSVLRIDGPTVVSGNPGSVNVAKVYLGADDFGAVPLNGDMAETLLYSGALSNANLNSLGAYLASKWAQTWSAI